MAGSRFGDLRFPPERYRANRAQHTRKRFETRTKAKAERRERIRLLRKDAVLLAEAGCVDVARAALQLAKELEAGGRRGAHTEADPVRLRRVRLIVVGWLWRFLRRSKLVKDTYFFTIVLPTWQYTTATLLDADPQLLLAAFRSMIVRQSDKNADGILLATIDGAYNPESGVFQLHVHGIASGGKLEAVRRLKKLPRLRSGRCKGQALEGQLGAAGDWIVDPVLISKRHVRRLPRPLLYICKQAWFAYRRPASISVLSQPKVKRHRGRIPEPAHTVALLWRHRCSLSSITLMMGMRLGRDGFELL